jgi:hypothetical protein
VQGAVHLSGFILEDTSSKIRRGTVFFGQSVRIGGGIPVRDANEYTQTTVTAPDELSPEGHRSLSHTLDNKPHGKFQRRNSRHEVCSYSKHEVCSYSQHTS